VRIRWKPEALAYRVRHAARADPESNGGQPEFSGSNGGQPEFSGSNGLRVNGRRGPVVRPGNEPNFRLLGLFWEQRADQPRKE
jgi:hypothetical protein